MSLADNSRNNVHVSHAFMARFGNNVLQMYRAFWFAAVHGLPDSCVVFSREQRGDLARHPMCVGVADHIVPPEVYNGIRFNRHYSCYSKAPHVIRRDLAKMELSDGDGVIMDNGYFLYPELPWERSLFIRLFGNIPYRDSVAEKYADVLRGNTVGYTVRRTDTVNRFKFRTLSESALLQDLRTIVRRHFGMVRILVTSDDPSFVEHAVAMDDFVRRRVYVVKADIDETLYLLSMCDYVFNNGQCQCSSAWVNDPESIYESTFGQLAQILNRSYKYAGFPCSPSPAELAALADGEPSALGRLCGGAASYLPLMYP